MQAGFARSGKMFAFEHADIVPDVVVMSKAVGVVCHYAYLPSTKIRRMAPAGHTVLSVAISLRWRHRFKHWMKSAAKTWQKMRVSVVNLRDELKKSPKNFLCIGNVRGRSGLMTGIEIVDERKPADRIGSYPADIDMANAIQRACFDNKLLLEKAVVAVQ